MSEHSATVTWRRQGGEDFTGSRYSRAHEWAFDGGATVAASASPEVVPLPYSVEANVDPEEAFVAALSSCHMLFFLAIAANKRYIVDEYIDRAVGRMSTGADGKPFVSDVVLRPEIAFSGERRPAPGDIHKMHELAHAQCFIANSVRTDVRVEPA